jgi:alpha-1,2-mannosyltransferase
MWLLACGLALCAIWPRLHLCLYNQPERRMIDLFVYRTGGQSFLDHRQLYYVGSAAHLPFTYPPIAAAFAVPLALTSWRLDQWIWVCAICLSLVACIRLSYRPVLLKAGRHAVMAGAALFTLCMYLEPMRDELHFGQVDVILLALCVADCLTDSPRWPRGALIGLATAIKLIPGVFIVYLLVSRRPLAARTAVLSAIAWTVLGFVILPGASANYWSHQIFDLNRIGSSSSTSDQSLHGLILHLSGHSSAPLALWLGVVLAVATLGFACARRVSLSGHETAGVAITALLGALLSPIAWIHEYSVIVVVIGAILGYGRSWIRVAAAAVVVLLFMLPIPYWGAAWQGMHGIPGDVAELVRSEYGIVGMLIIAFFPIALARSRPVRNGADHNQITDARIDHADYPSSVSVESAKRL